MIRLGYACMNATIKTSFKTCRLATMQQEGMEKIKELAIHNLEKTLDIIKWNIENDIFFYRASSDVIPFATHPEMTWDWERDEDVKRICTDIKNLAQQHNMRLSTHPGQYSVLNSPDIRIVDNCIKDFEYHAKFMDLIGATDMITHVGGVYGDKERAKDRWVDNYTLLSSNVKSKLRLENDDKSYNIQDVLDISWKCGVPVVLDIHHHNCNPYMGKISDILDMIMATWVNITHVPPKMHISTGKTSKTDRSHHDYVSEEDFNELMYLLGDRKVDIMIEAKKKEESIIMLRKIAVKN
jgi:UV DNA damage endonuclease